MLACLLASHPSSSSRTHGIQELFLYFLLLFPFRCPVEVALFPQRPSKARGSVCMCVARHSQSPALLTGLCFGAELLHVGKDGGFDGGSALLLLLSTGCTTGGLYFLDWGLACRGSCMVVWWYDNEDVGVQKRWCGPPLPPPWLFFRCLFSRTFWLAPFVLPYGSEVGMCMSGQRYSLSLSVCPCLCRCCVRVFLPTTHAKKSRATPPTSPPIAVSDLFPPVHAHSPRASHTLHPPALDSNIL